MDKLLSAKNVLTLIGVVSLIEGIGFYFGAEMVSQRAFPANLLEGGGFTVGTLLHQALGASVVAMSVIILFARSLETSAANRILNGVGVALLVFLGSSLIHLFNTEAKPPIPVLILFAIFALAAFYTANKKPA